MNKALYFLVCFILTWNVCNCQLYKDPAAPVDTRVEDLLSRMTVAEKVGQMTQAERGSVINNNDITTYFYGSVLSGGGSVPATNTTQGWADMYDMLQEKAMATRLGIPLLYGIDAVHGHNTLFGAVIFPHNIGMGCTHDPELVKLAARITAIEVSASGLDWTFSPYISVPRDERWGRTYEGFSEDPALVALMGAAEIEGYQGDTLADSCSVLACAKSFIGDGGTTRGENLGNTELDEATLRAVHLPPFIAAVGCHVATIMGSYSSWNGEKTHGSKYLMTQILKEELGFKGFVISDWNAIEELPGTYRERIKTAIDAGIDMSMEASNPKKFIDTLVDLVNKGELPVQRIDDAVRRILRIKFEAGLFERPYSNRSLLDSAGTKYHRGVARQCVRESAVMLKKRDDILPLAKEGMRILVAGIHADDVGRQCGGWTLSHQGVPGNIIPGTSIYEGLMQVAPGNTYTFSKDASDGENADVCIAVIGENSYAEGSGDLMSIDDVITSKQIALVKKAKSFGIPVIAILITGRPVTIRECSHYADVIIAAWLPGTEGEGIADIVFGNYTPTGKLSYTWPVDNAQLPINYGDTVYNPLYPFDYGITSFANTATGSDPEFYSAAVDPGGDLIELSFNKKMSLPAGEENNFVITANHQKLKVISFSYTTRDSSRIKLGIEPPVMKYDTVSLSYTPGNFFSADGGRVNAIYSYAVLNNSEYNEVSVTTAETTTGEMVAWPNPAKDICRLYLPGCNASRTQIELFDGYGRKAFVSIHPCSQSDLYEIGIGDLTEGLYFIRVTDGLTAGILKLVVR
jgi:beta-glucosidase